MGKLEHGAPLVVEDLDVTMKVTTYIDPSYVKYWRLKAFFAFFRLCEHPSETRRKAMEKFWGFDKK